MISGYQDKLDGLVEECFEHMAAIRGGPAETSDNDITLSAAEDQETVFDKGSGI